MKAIEAEGLSKTFENGVEAVIGLDLAVERGEIFGFLGPNGAGKTTTVRLLNGVLTPTSGRSAILGIPSQDDRVRRQTATLAELAQMYGHLSVAANLRFFARMYGIEGRPAADRIEELLTRMQLWEKRDMRLATLSTGMRQRVHLARTLLHRPEVVFLDEPTSGLDPEAALQVTALIGRLARERGTTVFLCTHNLPLAEGICHTFGFLRAGQLVAAGSREQMIRAAAGSQKVEIRTLTGRHELDFGEPGEIDGLIRRVQAGGEKVTEVLIHRPSLQDAYFRHIGRRGDELV
jgi:ABC-2 type transport system ATP-binding protein